MAVQWSQHKFISQVSLIIFLRIWIDVGNLTHRGRKRKTQCFRHKTHTHYDSQQ